MYQHIVEQLLKKFPTKNYIFISENKFSVNWPCAHHPSTGLLNSVGRSVELILDTLTDTTIVTFYVKRLLPRVGDYVTAQQ
jgi:hypothetical protein